MQAAPLPADATRRFGNTDVTVVDYGRLLARRPEHLPPVVRDWPRLGRRADGTVVLGMNGLVVQAPDAVVVVDPGGPVDALLESGRYEPGVGIDAPLDALGVGRERVTHVVVTHGHVDHFLGVIEDGTQSLRFPNAEHLFPAADLPGESASGPLSAEEFSRYLEPVVRAGRLASVRGDAAVCAGVDVLAAPGETPGHQVVRVSAPSGACYFLGDLVHFVDEVDHVDWVSFPDECDGGLLKRSRERIFADQGTVPATFLFAHGGHPGWGRIERVGGHWHWRVDGAS